MGLWNFMKGAGKSLFGGDEEATPEALTEEVADLGIDHDRAGHQGGRRKGHRFRR